MNKKVKFSGLWTAILSVVSVAYIFPILLVLINSFKKKAYISRYPFAIPTDKMFVGLENYPPIFLCCIQFWHRKG